MPKTNANTNANATTVSKTQENTLKNIKVSRKNATTIGLTIDVASYVNKSLTSEDLSGTGGSYMIATTGPKFVPLTMEGMEGVSIMVKVLTNRKEYDAAMELERNKSVAKEALAEMQAGPTAKELAMADIIAQQQQLMAQMQAQMAALMGQPAPVPAEKPKRTRKAAAKA